MVDEDKLDEGEDRGIFYSGWFGWFNIAIITAHIVSFIVVSVEFLSVAGLAQDAMVFILYFVFGACISGFAILSNLAILIARNLKGISYNRSEVKLSVISIFFPLLAPAAIILNFIIAGFVGKT